MRYPKLRALPRVRQRLETFYGYEHGENVRPGAFYDMCNLSSNAFPLLTVRPDKQRYFRGTYSPGGQVYELNIAPAEEITAAAAVNDTLVLATDTKLYYRGRTVAGAFTAAGTTRGTIVPFGRNFFVPADGNYVVTDESGVKEVRHAAFTQALPGAFAGYADEEGNAVTVTNPYPTAPTGAEEGDIWYNVVSGYPVQMIFTGGEWVKKSDVYVKIEHEAAALYAAPGDHLTLEGILSAPLPCEAVSAENGVLTVRCAVTDLPRGTYLLTVKKTMPPLDIAVEHLNRVWGCRYGRNAAGEFVNEIYASALGDPTVWYRFEGLSTDSFVCALGCPGEFTGAAVTGGDLIFFKEQYLIRVNGETPQDFSVSVTPARGVRKGCAATCAVLNEKIYYLSSGGVTVYDGALPYVISREFPTQGFSAASAAAGGGKYYLAATENGARRVYVYDPAVSLWHVEDDNEALRFFVTLNGCLYRLCRPGGANPYVLITQTPAGEAHNVFGPDAPDLVCRFEPLPQKTWYAETGRLSPAPGAGFVRGLVFRLSLEEGALFKAEIRCGSGRWQPLCKVKRSGEEAFSVRVNTPRCEHFRLRLSGEGGCTVYGVETVCEAAGEVKALVR